MSQTLIQPYLFFAGRCEEAIEFYSKALGAKVEVMMRHKESPDPHPSGMLAPGFEEKIMHSTVRIGDAVLMASDGCDDTARFDGFQLSLSLPDEEEAKRAFDGLSDGGKVLMPLTKTFWAPCFGMVTDRFGLAWMITVPTPPAP